MRKCFFFYIVLLSLLLEMSVCTGKIFAASLHEIPTITVLPYTNKAAVSIKKVNSYEAENSPEIVLQDASLVTDMVIEQLMDTHRFRIVEREYLEDVLDEIIYSRGGTVDSSTVLQAGKQLGAQYVIAGSISGLSTKDSGAGVGVSNSGAGFNKMAVVANVTIRFIDVETSEIILTASGVGESARTNAEFSLNRNVDKYDFSNSGIRVAIGGQDYSLVQVRNALYKAVGDMIYNKNYGILAKMDGKDKRKKV